MIRQRLVAGVVTATALVTLAACGSDKESSSTTELVTTAAPAATASDATVARTAATASDSSSGESTPEMSVPDISVPELTGECVELRKELPDISNATQFSTADVNKSFETLQARVPDDLEDDVATIRSSLQPFYDAVAKAGGNVTKAMQDPGVIKQAQTALTDPKFTSASTALNDWFTKGCPS